LLLTLASQSWKNGKRDEARARWRESSGEPFALADRLRGWLLCRKAGDHGFPEFLDQSALRSLLLTKEDGSIRQADRHLLQRLNADERADLERWIGELLATAPAGTMERFNWSRVVRSKQKESAQAAERAGNDKEAARLYRLLLDGTEDEIERGQAEADRLSARDGLVRIYQKLQ
jgi:hypothetical protein